MAVEREKLIQKLRNGGSNERWGGGGVWRGLFIRRNLSIHIRVPIRKRMDFRLPNRRIRKLIAIIMAEYRCIYGYHIVCESGKWQKCKCTMPSVEGKKLGNEHDIMYNTPYTLELDFSLCFCHCHFFRSTFERCISGCKNAQNVQFNRNYFVLNNVITRATGDMYFHSKYLGSYGSMFANIDGIVAMLCATENDCNTAFVWVCDRCTGNKRWSWAFFVRSYFR